MWHRPPLSPPAYSVSCLPALASPSLGPRAEWRHYKREGAQGIMAHIHRARAAAQTTNVVVAQSGMVHGKGRGIMDPQGRHRVGRRLVGP